MEDPPFVQTGDDPLRMEDALDNIIPELPDKPYDIKEIIRLIVDNAEFYEIQENYRGQYRDWVCAPRRTFRRHRCESTSGAGRRARY